MTRPPDPKPWEEIYLAENPLFGVKADPLGLGVQMTCPKTTCEELIRPWKFCAALANKLKVMALFRSDARMHGHTEVRMHGPRPASLPLGFFAWETKNPTKFLPLRSFLSKYFKLAIWWYPVQVILELIKGLKIPNLLETCGPFVHSITCLLFLVQSCSCREVSFPSHHLVTLSLCIFNFRRKRTRENRLNLSTKKPGLPNRLINKKFGNFFLGSEKSLVKIVLGKRKQTT